MKITVIYGTMHKGSTYNCVQLLLGNLAKKTQTQVTEFFMPKDMPNFCAGCFTCFGKGEDKCPHYVSMHPIEEALIEADLIVLSSPVYVYNVSGQLKALLDHFGYRWMPHRPHPSMFHKTGVVISTTAGGGQATALKTMKKNLSMWGVRRVFSYGKAVQAAGWEGVNSKKKETITTEIEHLSDKVYKATQHIHKLIPPLGSVAWYSIIKLMVKSDWWNKTDQDFWREQGWLSGKSPWK